MLEQTIHDDWGNAIWRDGSFVYLRLACETKRRNIGTISKLSDGRLALYKGLTFSKHLYETAEAIGFNWIVLQMLGDNDVLAVHDSESGNNYTIDVKKAREVGSFLHFKKQGFERQFFVKLADFTKEAR